jgi:hypothetical protein
MRYSGMLLHGEYAERADDLYGGTSDGEIIADQAAANVLHKSINVPDNRCPFDEGPRNVFLALLGEIQAQNIIPEGYAVMEQEWAHGFYPNREAINIGRGRKETDIVLPFDVWWPRAVSWAQGLDLLLHLS